MDVNSGIYLVRADEGTVCAEHGVYPPGLPYRMEPGPGHYRVPLPRQQVHAYGQKIEGPAPKPLPWLRVWVSDEGDLMVDRSTDIPPLQFLRI